MMNWISGILAGLAIAAIIVLVIMATNCTIVFNKAFCFLH